LHNPQLFFFARFNSARVMENISIVVCEGEFVVDVMLATLYPA